MRLLRKRAFDTNDDLCVHILQSETPLDEEGKKKSCIHKNLRAERAAKLRI